MTPMSRTTTSRTTTTGDDIVSTTTTEAASGGSTLRLDQVHAHPLNPRGADGFGALEDLAASIGQLGVLEPVLVMPLAMWSEGDRPRPLAWLGAALAVAGAAGVAICH